MSIEPIVPNLPSALTSLNRKYTSPSSPYSNASSILEILRSAPSITPSRPITLDNTINPLIQFDQARVNRGQSPLTKRESLQALKTLATGKPATPPRRQGFAKALLGDLKSLVGSIPHLPQGIYREIQSLPDLPAALSSTIASSDNPLQALGNVASLPGARMVPGAHVARTVLGDEEHGGGQGLEGILAHPLFAALDVLPVASGAARLTPVARAAKSAYASQVETLAAGAVARGLHPSTATLPARPRALQTVLTRRLDPTGAVVPNRLGQSLASASDTFASTNVGQAFRQTFQERDTSIITERFTNFLREAQNRGIDTESLRYAGPGGNAAIAPELRLRDLSTSIQTRLADLGFTEKSPEMAMLTDRIGLSKLPDGTPLPPEQMLDLPPAVREIIREIRDTQHAYAAYTDNLPGTDRTRTLTIDGTPETFDYRTAQTLSKAQRLTAETSAIIEARALATSPHHLTPDQLDAAFNNLIPDNPSSATVKEITRLEAAAREIYNTPSPTRIIDTLRPLVGKYPKIPVLIDHIKNGRWVEARHDLTVLSQRRYGQVLPIDFDALRAEVTAYRKRDDILARTADYTDKRLERVKKIQSKVESRAVPARFSDLVGEKARATISDRVRETFATHPDLDRLIELADAGIYDSLSTLDPAFTRLVRKDQADARASWKALRDAGHDPIYFQRVTPQQAKRQPFIRLAETPTSLRSVRARMFDAAPYVKDVGVALNQASLDILQRRASQASFDMIGEQLGRTRASLVEEYAPRVNFSPDASIPPKAQLDKLLKARWSPWEPSKYGGRPAGVFSPESADSIWVPREVAENLKRMYEPPLPRLTATFDPVMNFFRTSVLPLAARWHLNNIFGNAIVTAVADPRAFLEIPAVWKQLWHERRDGLPAAESRLMQIGAPPPGLGPGMPQEARAWAVTKDSPITDRLVAAAEHAAGGTLKRLYDTARESRISKMPDNFRKAVETSYSANQFVDDVFRAAVGQSERRRLLRSGMSDDAIDAMVASKIRRTFQQWDAMTPMERSVMRSVMPFYGYAAYATRFALRYPFDHPFRVQILTSIADAEMTDGMTGLPQYIRDMVFLGDPRANKVTRALNVAPFNPFGGVPSMFTVAGFLGQLNPVITGVLESVGVDVQQGGPQLYPNLQYDPETGRLQANPSGNLVSNIVGNISPQLQGIQSLLGFNDQFNDTLARDPQAAGRMLMSQFGLPILHRDINVGEQLIRSELARMKDQDTARKDALKTGNLSVLGDFPGLAGYAEQIRALEKAGALDQYRAQEGEPGAQSGAGVAYALQAATIGG